VREDLASHLKIPQSKVRCICDVMGGGFGSKFGAGVEGGLAAKLAREAGAPVKMLLDRKSEFLAVGNRPNTVQNLKLAADKDGKLVAFSCDGYGTGGLSGGSQSEGGGGGVAWPAPYLYPVPNASTNIVRVLTNTGAGRAFRAPQHPPASFGMESVMDLLAYKMGIDPLEFRLRNDPNPVRQKEYLAGAERFGWKEKFHAPGAGGPGPLKRGVGVAAASWGTGGNGSKAECQIHPDGSVEVRCGTQDLGTGSRTLVAIVAAETFGLQPQDITARVGDTNFPPSGGSGGSTTSPSVAPAIRVACTNALNAINTRVGEDGSWRERCARLGVEPIVEQGAWQPGLSGSGVGGVQFGEVEVDIETGQVRVVHMTVIQDAGLIINRLASRSQAHGGIIQGIGYALFEERIMDDQTGVMLNSNFETYKLPNIADIPTIDVVYMDLPERGVIGLGEAAHIPSAACIANAVHNAIGVRVTELPMTPARVLAALEQKPA
jgi:xanthine dehydrogenase YagR molybdenum-binding subunit